MEIVKANNITKRYSNHLALSKLDLTVPKGSIFGLLGPNGAGKTTFLRIINQIIFADEGSITIDGTSLGQHHIEMIGYLPEERGLYKKMKVGEHLLYFARLKGLNRTESIKRIKVWFKKLDIPDWLDKKVEDLSKGMQQKVQFVATVLHEPKLIILDEPFSGFDPINANIIKDEILELREKGSTVIFSTHRMESVEELCDYIALINEAEKILDGPKKEIKNNFRDGTYRVEHYQPIDGLSRGFEIRSTQDIGEGLFESRIHLANNHTANDLIQQLISKTEIKTFEEVIPTVNDIFIRKVKEGGSNG
jgi:ABC-2 type transport system ATP-binding protein